MASFKHKPEKLKYLTNINTLDEVHREHVESFETKKKNLPKKKLALETFKKELLNLQKKNIMEISQDDIKKKSLLKEKIKEIENEIDEIENGFAEIDYYSRTHEVLVEYYKQLEDGDDDNTIIEEDNENQTENNYSENNYTESATENKEKLSKLNINTNEKLALLNKLSQQKRKVKKETKRRVRRNETITKKKNILSFFSEKKPDQNTTECSPTESEINTTPKSDSNIEQIVSNRASLYESYMNLINKSQVVSNKSKLIRNCDNCGTEKTLIQSEGMYVCRKCGEVENIVIESEVPNHKDSINEKPRYPYKRLNHLLEWLNQLKLLTEIVLITN